MNVQDACTVIEAARTKREAVLIATMGAMVALDKIGAAQPRLNSVPLMGGAASLGLGVAVAHPQRHVVVVDGDASLLLQLGGLVTVAGAAPRKFLHCVVHNGTQFTGLSNLCLPGAQPVDFVAMALAAGYRHACRIATQAELQAQMEALLDMEGPVLVELVVTPEPASFSAENPQKDWSDHQFTRMGQEAKALAAWLQEREHA